MSNKSRDMMLLPLLMGMMGGMDDRFMPPIPTPEPDYTNLIKEYKLIQAKKSGLSRSQRDGMVARVQYLVREGKINPEDLK